MYFFIAILSKWLTPYSELMNEKAHSTLIAFYLAAAADIFDFLEYGDNEHILHKFKVSYVYCNKKFISLLNHLT